MSVQTIDASVFGNAVFPDEAGHDDSRGLLARVQALEAPVVVPTLLLPELSALVARRTDRADQAERLVDRLRALPNFTFVPLSTALAKHAAVIAARHRLRGADAVYVTVAHRYGAVLVTQDQEQRERAGDLVASRSPSEAYAAL